MRFGCRRGASTLGVPTAFTLRRGALCLGIRLGTTLGTHTNGQLPADMGRGIISAGLHRTERVKLEARTTDPPSPASGERWLRTDLNSETDKLAELRWYDGSSVKSINVVAIGTTDSGVAEPLRIQTPNGLGVIPAISPPADAGYPSQRLQHNRSVFGLGLNTIPDTGDHQWRITKGSGTTLSDSVGDIAATVNGPSWYSDSGAVGEWALDFDGTDDYWVSDSRVGNMETGSVFGWARLNDFTGFENYLVEVSSDGDPGISPQGGINLFTRSSGVLDAAAYEDSGGGGSMELNASFPTSGWGFFVLSWQESQSDARLITYDNSQNLSDVTGSMPQSWSNYDNYVCVGGSGGEYVNGRQDIYGAAVGSRISRTQADDFWNATKR